MSESWSELLETGIALAEYDETLLQPGWGERVTSDEQQVPVALRGLDPVRRYQAVVTLHEALRLLAQTDPTGGQPEGLVVMRGDKRSRVGTALMRWVLGRASKRAAKQADPEKLAALAPYRDRLHALRRT